MPPSSPLRSVAAGATFGAALTASGVFSPAVIIAQMRLEDFHMLKAFIAASATSAIVILLANRLAFASTSPRSPNSLGRLGAYDGNILGGLLLGAGMTLTGACPGTVLPQIATGVVSGPLVLVGGVLGGAAYVQFGRALQAAPPVRTKTVYEACGVGWGAGLLVYEIVCAGAVGAAVYLAPGDGEALVPGIVGGLLIGATQAVSLLLTGSTLGSSAAYEQVGDLLWWGIDWSGFRTKKGKKKTARPNIRATAFAAGAVAGSWALSRVVTLPTLVEVDIAPWRAVVGGAIMIFGSRLAGGCTSGHGISGMAQLSTSSIISVVSIFVGGIALAAVLR